MSPSIASDLDLREVAILFGAGISLDLPSATPLGANLTRCLLKNSLHEECLGYPEVFLTSSDVQNEMGLYLRFERVCEALEVHGGNLNFLRFFSEYKFPNENHVALALLAKAGATLLTTNFDRLVEIAASDLLYDLKVVNLTEGDCFGLSPNTLYKLHGSIGESEFNNSNNSLATTVKSVSNPQLTRRLNSFLQTALQKKHLIVMGYSGYDDFDVSPALVSIISDKRLIWLNHDGTKRDSIEPQSIGGFENEPKPKSMILCEKIIARAARRPDDVRFISCHTGKVLAMLKGQADKPCEQSSFVAVDYRGHISRWADFNLDETKRRCISVDLLLTLHQTSRAHALLVDLIDIRLPIDGMSPVQRHLLLRYLSCLCTSPDLITEIDINYVILQCGADIEYGHSDIDLLTNLGGVLQAVDETELAVQCFRRASQLIQVEEDSERKLRTDINLALSMTPQAFSDRYWVESLVARAERCGALRLLPTLLYSLADDDHPIYYLRTVDASALVGDRDAYVRAAVNSFNLTDKHRPLLMALHADSSFFESIAKRDPPTFITFCALMARYLCDAKLPGAREVAMRGWSLLESHSLGTKENRCYYADELVGILKRVGEVDLAHSFIDENFQDIESLEEPWARFNILGLKYSLAPSVEASVAARSYALKCIQHAKKNGSWQEIAAALSYLNDTNNALTCFEISKVLRQIPPPSNELARVEIFAASALFNLGRWSEAKEWFLLVYQRSRFSKIDDSGLLFNLARIELAQGNLESAARLLLCSDELGDRTLFSTRVATRDQLRRRMPESKFNQLANEITLKMRYTADYDSCVREILESTGLFNES